MSSSAPAQYAWVIGGAILGAWGRAGLSALIPHDDPATWPWATFLTNLLGCLLMGALAWLVEQRYSERDWVRPFFGVGILGGFTTYSTFALETVRLAEAGRTLVAAAYIVLSVSGALLAILLGRNVIQALAKQS